MATAASGMVAGEALVTSLLTQQSVPHLSRTVRLSLSLVCQAGLNAIRLAAAIGALWQPSGLCDSIYLRHVKYVLYNNNIIILCNNLPHLAAQPST